MLAILVGKRVGVGRLYKGVVGICVTTTVVCCLVKVVSSAGVVVRVMTLEESDAILSIRVGRVAGEGSQL